MNVEEALTALTEGKDPDFPVVIMRKDRGLVMAAPVLGVALDDESDDASLVMGEFSEEDAALEGAVSIGEIRAALEELRFEGAQRSIFSTALEDPTSGGSLVGYSVDDDIEVFAFLQGPKSSWEGD